jgi:hypothetical protein
MMPGILKRNAVIAFGLAVLFYWAFMFAKHDAAFRGIIPFGEDPYDAVGSFGIVVGAFIAIVSLVRAFRPYRSPGPTMAQTVYLLRSQAAVALTVCITLAADVVAMVRHPSMWIGSASRNALLALLGGLAVAATGLLLLVRASRAALPERGPNRWTAAILASMVFPLILAIYPEQLIHVISTHLLTVVIGAIALFAPMRLILTAMVPYDPRIELKRRRGRFSSPRSRWGIVLLAGILLGAFAFIGEMSEGGGGAPLGRLLLVASVFVGLAIAGLIVAYSFLGNHWASVRESDETRRRRWDADRPETIRPASYLRKREDIHDPRIQS